MLSRPFFPPLQDVKVGIQPRKVPMFPLLTSLGSGTSYLDCIPGVAGNTGTPRMLPWGGSSMYVR